MTTDDKPGALPGRVITADDLPEQEGLPGTMPRPIHITILGAGSMFTPRLVGDLLCIRGLKGGTIALVDIDSGRLRTMARLVKRLVLRSASAGRRWQVTASEDRTAVMKGTDYLVNCIEVSGLACVRHDNDIPVRYGVDQCIGDTIGPGGLFKALRTVPVWLDVLRDAERLCPHALVLNYTNPMSILCLAAARVTALPVVGLCHSVQETSHLLARRAGIRFREMVWNCAGINHLSWFTLLQHEGKNLYPLLMKKAREDLAGRPSDPEDAGDLVRKDIMLHFGAFVTESSGHLSEYLPFYRKRPDLLARYGGEGYDGASGFYADQWPGWRSEADRKRAAMLKGALPVRWRRSLEYASVIVEAREKNVPVRIYGNVMNGGPATGCPARASASLITNLPSDGIVEVACMVDGSGVRPVRHGGLPPQMAALCDWNMRMFDLAAAAAIKKSKEAAIHALMLDPLSAAVCSPAEIKAMALEMFRAESDYLPGYR